MMYEMNRTVIFSNVKTVWILLTIPSIASYNYSLILARLERLRGVPALVGATQSDGGAFRGSKRRRPPAKWRCRTRAVVFPWFPPPHSPLAFLEQALFCH